MADQAAALAGFHDLEPVLDDFETAVLAGLASDPKSLPCKFFYDDAGSQLFERICALPEYYPTRTETALLQRRAGEMAERMGRGCHLIEFGSGASEKVRILLRAVEAPAAYTAVDISRDHLLVSAASLARAFPGLEVHAVCADYTRPFEVAPPSRLPGARRVGFFPGSTIGNFTPDEAVAFLESAARLLDGGDLLIGVDLEKDEATLNAAYNDAEGVTAAFNLNLLARINRELGADFELSAFAHRAFYDAHKGRIEMHLVSRRDQTVTISGRSFRFRQGESIHTENSHKYTVDGFARIARRAGFKPAHVWIDDHRLFAIHYLSGGAG